MHQRQRGATLIELLIVLGIGGLTAGLIWQAGPLGARLALRAAAAGIVSELRTAQARSLGERNPDRAYGLEFAAGGDRYTLFTRTGGCAPRSGPTGSRPGFASPTRASAAVLRGPSCSPA